MANQPARGRKRGSPPERSGQRARRRRVEMVTLSATAHCGPGSRRRRTGVLATIFRTTLLAALLLAPTLIAAGASGQTVTLDPPPDSPYWQTHAPQARGGPSRSGATEATLAADGPGLRWEVGGFEPFFAGAVSDPQNAYVVDRGGNVTALNLTTGTVVWSRDLNERVTATPALAYGWLYIATEKKHLFALSARSGTVLANATLSGAAKVSPLVAEGKVFQGDDAGTLQVLDAATLEKLWSFDTGVTRYNANGTVNATDATLRKPLRAPPAVHDGRVYLASWNHRVYALSTTGNLHGTPSAWHWTRDTGDLVHAAPAVDRHRAQLIVATGDGRLQALRLDTGTVKWTVDAGLGFHGGASVAKDRIVATTDDGRILAVNHTTGAVQWERTDPSGFLAGPTLAPDALVTQSANGTVHLRAPANGTLLQGTDGQALQWKLAGSAHAAPAVTRRGIVAADQSGTITLIGPSPVLRADLVAGVFKFIGNVTAEGDLNISLAVTNAGPDAATVTATLFADDVAVASTALGKLGAGTTNDWSVRLAPLGPGGHVLRVTFTADDAPDPTPGDAARTTDLTLRGPTSLDPVAQPSDAETAPGPGDRGTTASFGGGFAATLSVWSVLGALVALAAGVGGTRWLRTRAAGAPPAK